MPKKSISEWTKEISELLNNYTKDYPDTDILLAINSITDYSEDGESDVITSIDVSSEKHFQGIISYLTNCYYAEAILDEREFPEDAKFVDYWLTDDSDRFSQN